MSETRIIATIQKNAREELRVELGEFKGHQLASLRVWVEKQDGSGKIPTPKGVTFAVALLPAVVPALIEAERAARADGLLPSSQAAE
jgi:hypothetical protein